MDWNKISAILQTGDAENIALFLCRKRQEYFEAGKSCGAVEPPTASDTARQSRSGVVLFYENGAFYGAVNAQKQKIREFNRVLKTVQDKKGDIMSKKHISIWIDEKNLKECEANIQLTKCRSSVGFPQEGCIFA